MVICRVHAYLVVCAVAPALRFYGNSDDTLGGIILVTGGVLYLILTVVYIVIGFKKVRAWQWWMSVIAVLISLGMGFAGIFGATDGVELINGYLFV